MSVEIRVAAILKPTINDPEGVVIRDALHSLGFEGVVDVRTGRFFETTLLSEDEVDLTPLTDHQYREVAGMPSKVLYDYEIERLEEENR